MSNLNISYVVNLYYMGDRSTTGDRFVKELKGDDLTELLKEIHSKYGVGSFHYIQIGVSINHGIRWYR